MKRYFRILAAGIAMLLLAPIAQAQDETAKKTPDFAFVVTKTTDGGYSVKTRVTLYENRKDIPIAWVPVNITIGDDPARETVINTSTDSQGYGEAIIEPGFKMPRDKEGKVHMKAVFPGSPELEPAEAEVSFQEVNLKMNLELVDSVKTVKLTAFKLDAQGKELPLEGESVSISVQRMLSRLPIGDITIDAEGNGSLEFPADLPGTDSLGTVQVIASISENENYGNLEMKASADWGKPKEKVSFNSRTLWSHIAPVWMIISLTIMLVGVWAHYLYVVIQLIRIKRKGKKEKLVNA